MNNVPFSSIPLKRLGYVVLYHEARAEDATSKAERMRHRAIAKKTRILISRLFAERFALGEYDEAA